jgi:hypothetical protein
MRGKRLQRVARVLSAVLLAALVIPAANAAKKQKLKAEDLLALHLDSIGPAEVRAGMKSRLYRGKGIWRAMVGGSGQMHGTVLHASEEGSCALRFDTQGNPAYYGEHLIFDGKEVRVLMAFQNGRSPLGEFFWINKAILQEGLLGGATSNAWALLRRDPKKLKLKYRGLKKVDERELHRLDYRPKKGGSSLNIWLFFEPETYHHVQTSYRQKIPAPPSDNPLDSARMQDSYTTVTETFWNFQEIDGLNLPSNWKIHYNRAGQGRTEVSSIVWEWEMGFTSASHNEPIDPAYYKVGTPSQ